MTVVGEKLPQIGQRERQKQTKKRLIQRRWAAGKMTDERSPREL